MAIKNNYDIIFSQRNADLKTKDEAWKLIYDAYIGGVQFKNGDYLIKYPKESYSSFEKRKARSVYFNQVSPIVDMLSGMLFLNTPTRKIPAELSYFTKNTSGDKDINEFMRIVVAHSLMFTCGILIDSPSFDPDEIKTKLDRVNNKINPYATLYLPTKIRDFWINPNDGGLEWILLDNSYVDHSDPMKVATNVTEYRLWTRNDWKDFRRRVSTNEVEIESGTHNLGIVPFRFVSWRDDNNDFVGETIFEDIAMISKLVYNNMSYMDEMLASGTFKMLLYPTQDGKIPKQITEGGVGPLSIIPYNMASSTVPSFAGADLTAVDPFIKAINFYMTEILKKVGLSTDEMKEFVKSGAAKKIDMQKMRALLLSGAITMGKVEEWMYETAAKWEGRKDITLKVEYTTGFSNEDLITEMQMLTEMLTFPVYSLRKNILELMVKKLLSNYLEPETLDEIYKDIQNSVNAEQSYEVGNPIGKVGTIEGMSTGDASNLVKDDKKVKSEEGAV